MIHEPTQSRKEEVYDEDTQRSAQRLDHPVLPDRKPCSQVLPLVDEVGVVFSFVFLTKSQLSPDTGLAPSPKPQIRQQQINMRQPIEEEIGY